MTRWLPFLLLLVAAAPTERTLAQRKRFAEQHPMKLVIDWADDKCIPVMGPPALGCTRPAWVCPASMSNAVCSGSFSEVRGVTLRLHEPTNDEADAEPLPELELESEFGDDCPLCECMGEVGFTVSDNVSKAEAERLRREFAKQHAHDEEKCVREAAARQKAERVKRTCTLLLVDPCREEAFIRCTGKNGDVSTGDTPLGKTLQFSFARQADGGVPLGGEWTPPDDE